MNEKREGHEPGRAGPALKENKTPQANVRSLAVVFCMLCELLLTDGEDAVSSNILSQARELVRRTQ